MRITKYEIEFRLNAGESCWRILNRVVEKILPQRTLTKILGCIRLAVCLSRDGVCVVTRMSLLSKSVSLFPTSVVLDSMTGVFSSTRFNLASTSLNKFSMTVNLSATVS